MKTVPLGNSGVQVSAMCLGTMRFGTSTDEGTSFRILDAAMEAGVTFMDTANVYSAWVPGFKGGESETLLGKWMKERRNRDRIFLATKLGSRFQVSGRGLKPAQVRDELDASLKRLQVGHVDLLYSHFDDPSTPIADTMQTYAEVIRTGRVRFIGASNFAAWRLGEVRRVCEDPRVPGYVCVQQRYSYAQPVVGAKFGLQVAANDDLVDYCRQFGLTLIAYSPLLGGAYGGRVDRPFTVQYQSVRNDRRLAVLKAMAEKKRITASQLVLAWMMNTTPRVVPIIGASTIEQFRENLAASEIALSPADMESLDKAGD